ncbi:FHA domain-containing protein FhaA [Corynebacterium urogenitale]|uniref:FHA domain-containing protein FhaA n=1 Tax=Corynebacterium urogenitale TaxID=2487892 RepID=A0A5J6Z306_9CORY|nr:DUF3662 and FHA domain-containing protein [Corynebacterium urogenitale]QFQ01448.1 FHA domain-containing protein FhaA [Corynebacterium urogenitale]
MDLFGRFRKLDSSLQRGLDNGFARVFGGEVVPAEIDELLKQQAESSVMMDPDGNRWAPCHFMVNVSQRDYDSLVQKHPDLAEDLSDRLQRFIRNSGWRTNASVQVHMDTDANLHTGQLKANSLFNAPPAPRAESSGSPSSSSDANPGLSSVVQEAPGSERSHDYSQADYGQSRSATSGADADPQEASAPGTAGASGAAAAGTFTNEWNRHPGEDAYQSSQQDSYPQYSQQAQQPQQNPEANASYPQSAQPQGAQPGSEQNPNSYPQSYPGTEVMAQNVYSEDPITGASGDHNEAQTQVTLILRDGSDRRYELREGSNLIGRGNGVDLRIPDTGVSRQHAEIAWDGYDAVLTDLQSTNGTSVNETPIENWLLADGDIIVMGHSEIEVQFG